MKIMLMTIIITTVTVSIIATLMRGEEKIVGGRGRRVSSEQNSRLALKFLRMAAFDCNADKGCLQLRNYRTKESIARVINRFIKQHFLGLNKDHKEVSNFVSLLTAITTYTHTWHLSRYIFPL